MNRSLSILFILITVVICSVFVPASAGAQKEGSGVAIKKDGDFVVLIPREPGKAFLVLGIPREKKELVKGLQGDLFAQTGAVKLSAKKYEKVFVLELGPGTEVDLDQVDRYESKPLPPGCPPHCPGLLAYIEAYLIWPDRPEPELAGGAVKLPGAEIP